MPLSFCGSTAWFTVQFTYGDSIMRTGWRLALACQLICLYGCVRLGFSVVDQSECVVRYDAGTGAIGEVPEAPPCRVGDSVTVAAADTLLRKHHTFAGWYTQPDGGGTRYAPGDIIVAKPGAMTLYATWRCVEGLTIECQEAFGASGACGRGVTSCVDGSWLSCSVAPALADSCESGDDATCNGIPNEGCPCLKRERTCSEAVLLECDQNGSLQPVQVCQFVCRNGSCTGVCTPGARRCEGAVPYLCDAVGDWIAQPCDLACVDGNCTGVCAPGAQSCSGSTAEECNSQGAWVGSTWCSDIGMFCQQGACITYAPQWSSLQTTASTITLGWSTPPGAVTYRLEWAENLNLFATGALGELYTGQAASFAHEPTPNQLHHYVVTALNSKGQPGLPSREFVAGTQGTRIFLEGFESFASGSFPGWPWFDDRLASGDADIVNVVTSPVGSGGRAVQLGNNPNGGWDGTLDGIHLEFPAIRPSTIRWWGYQPGPPVTAVKISDDDLLTSSTIDVVHRYGWDGQKVVIPGASCGTGAFGGGTTFELRNIDYDAGTYEAYVNGGLHCTPLFGRATPFFTRFYLGIDWSSVSNYVWDDIEFVQ